jgi:hypothetical protein
VLTFIPYREATAAWPAEGRHILATWNDDSVVVYQAYRPSIGSYAATHGYFGGEFSTSRMSWIKPNFLWMMYRSGWGTKPEQEVTLAVRLRREAFDAILAGAVPSSFVPELYGDRDTWQREVAASEVRLQWDPDHDPAGRPVARRAIQLGLRGSMLMRYTREWVLGIEDISAVVARERANIGAESLLVPAERPYPVRDRATARRLGVSV